VRTVLARRQNSRCSGSVSATVRLVPGLRDDLELQRLLDRLHAQSLTQDGEIRAHFAEQGSASVVGSRAELEQGRAFWRDKLVALDADKAQLCYALCRALGARRVVEAGTSFGVSTLYLAAAVRDNGGGTVLGAEQEPGKVAVARGHFREAGLEAYIDLREGDILEALAGLEGPVDFLLLDIWTPLARPVLERVAPHLRAGAIVATDNTVKRRQEYGALLAYLGDPASGFITQTLPFDGGFEISVKVSGP
jgi:predicted O-methyltransferase YrrM